MGSLHAIPVELAWDPLQSSRAARRRRSDMSILQSASAGKGFPAGQCRKPVINLRYERGGPVSHSAACVLRSGRRSDGRPCGAAVSRTFTIELPVRARPERSIA